MLAKETGDFLCLNEILILWPAPPNVTLNLRFIEQAYEGFNQALFNPDWWKQSLLEVVFQIGGYLTRARNNLDGYVPTSEEKIDDSVADGRVTSIKIQSTWGFNWTIRWYRPVILFFIFNCYVAHLRT